MNDYRFRFPQLYQFFGGYFYQGWALDYRWENGRAEFAAVVRHFKAVNPPATVGRVRVELAELIGLNLAPDALGAALRELGSSFHAPGENLTEAAWLGAILEILDESTTRAKVLRELR